MAFSPEQDARMAIKSMMNTDLICGMVITFWRPGRKRLAKEVPGDNKSELAPVTIFKASLNLQDNYWNIQAIRAIAILFKPE